MDTKGTGPVAEEATAGFARRTRAKAAEFRAAHAGRKLTVSTIERLWGNAASYPAEASPATPRKRPPQPHGCDPRNPTVATLVTLRKRPP
ncbi:MAG: hypothetical protein LBG27_05595 [Spirochaetaceae bacterium]|nr:hypothetical protein [Spirochaetaceae bacterium]